MVLDTKSGLILIPIEKWDRAVKALKELIKSRTVTVHRLQQITGFLNHLGKAIFPVRAFTRRYYTKMLGSKLKPHYHINVDWEIKSDSKVWLTFLTQDPMAACRPFVY